MFGNDNSYVSIEKNIYYYKRARARVLANGRGNGGGKSIFRKINQRLSVFQSKTGQRARFCLRLFKYCNAWTSRRTISRWKKNRWKAQTPDSEKPKKSSKSMERTMTLERARKRVGGDYGESSAEMLLRCVRAGPEPDSVVVVVQFRKLFEIKIRKMKKTKGRSSALCEWGRGERV